MEASHVNHTSGFERMGLPFDRQLPVQACRIQYLGYRTVIPNIKELRTGEEALVVQIA